MRQSRSVQYMAAAMRFRLPIIQDRHIMSIIYRRGAWIMDGSGWVEGRERRDRGGRFAAGVSGNPAGKRKGTRNRATIMAEMLAAAASGVPAKNSAAETP